MDPNAVATSVTLPAAGVTPPAVVPPAPPVDTHTQEGVTPPESKTYDEVYVKRINAENAQRRQALADAEAKIKAYEDEKLTAQQKIERDLADAQKERDALTTQNRELLLQGSIKDAALAAGMAPAQIAASWALAERGLLEYDKATGQPTRESLGAVVAAMKATYPQLFGAANTLPASGGATSPGRSMGQSGAKVDPLNPWSGAEWKD